MKRSGSYDYYLILATVAVLFVISAVCIYAMFAFKIAQVQNMPGAEKALFMHGMNSFIAPFLIALILLLGICIPKRLLPTSWLNIFAMALMLVTLGVSLLWGAKTALLVVLFAATILQIAVLGLALFGSQVLHFEKSGYWLRLGSSLIHLGVIMFILDLYFHRQQTLHLVFFWVTTVATVSGMLCCFYADAVARLVKMLTSKGKNLP